MTRRYDGIWSKLAPSREKKGLVVVYIGYKVPTKIRQVLKLETLETFDTYYD